MNVHNFGEDKVTEAKVLDAPKNVKIENKVVKLETKKEDNEAETKKENKEVAETITTTVPNLKAPVIS